MKLNYFAVTFFCIMNLSSTGYSSGQPCAEYPKESLLLSAVYIYHGDNIGSDIHITGPQCSSDGGRTWQKMAWDTLITNAIEVDGSGRNIYCACGNGVLVSNDGGRNWRLSGGWQMTEVQDVKIGPESQDIVWAASAYGVYLSKDGAETWEKIGSFQPFRFVSTLEPDRSNSSKVFIGTEDGLFVTEDYGLSYNKTGPESPIRSILQDLRNPEIIWVGTDGEGLFRSDDGGDTWTPVEGPGSVVNRIVQNDENPEWIYCGLDHGIAFSWDYGLTWKFSSKGLIEFSPVYALCFDKQNRNRIYAGTYDGLFISDDCGLTWFTYFYDDGSAVLEDAVIRDLWKGYLYRGPEEPPSDESGSLVIDTNQPTGDEFRQDIAPGFEDRLEKLRKYFAATAQNQLENFEKGSYIDSFSAIVLIKEGLANEALWNILRERYSRFGHSMFDSFPAISFYLQTKEYLPEDIKSLLRKNLVSNYFYRGDTENHWLMYYTALLLTAQEWPESSAREWYTGRTSQYNYDEALGWINEWVRITTSIGQGEFDSPSYYNMFVSPCLLLYSFAKDPQLKRQTGMILDLLLADMAAESLEGRYCGGHSRIHDNSVIFGDSDASSSYFYLYFGGIDMPTSPHSWIVNGLYSDYRCPEVIANIALMRTEPYIHTEVKRVRNCIRYSEELNPPVFKYDYMTSNFCMGSLQGGILQPIQQHTWDITWIGSAPNTTLFSLHPYYDAYELAMFFPEDPHVLTRSVQAQKNIYTNPQKLISSSPYERIFQYKDTLIALYNVPESAVNQFVTVYLPDCLNMYEQDGYLIGRDDKVYIAIYLNGRWERFEEPNSDYPPADRIKIMEGQTAVIVEAGSEETDGSFEQFNDLIREKRAFDFSITDGSPKVIYENRHGNILEFDWRKKSGMVDNNLYWFPKHMLFNGPYMIGIVGERVIEIRDNDKCRILDFNNLTIKQISIGEKKTLF